MNEVPASLGKQWALTGLPLMVAGVGCLWLAVLYPSGFQFLVFLFAGLVFSAGSLLALSRRRWCRRLAIVAWLPMFFVLPVGTILIFFAIPALRRDPDGPVPAPNSRSRRDKDKKTPEELMTAVAESARWALGIRDRNWDLEIVRDLRVTPANLDQYLDDLEESYGLPVGRADRRGVKTLTDVAGFLGRELAA